MNYGRAIKIVRTAYGLSQAELAKRLSVGPSQLSLIEKNKRQPSVRVLQEVSTALQVPLHLLMLLASRPEDLDDKADPKQVAEVARALLNLLIRAGEQQGLPLEQPRETTTRKRSE
jgi:transcriptional regulator with XRE-family HTH domain